MKTTTRRRTAEPARVLLGLATGQCTCHGGPTLVATFRAERLADVELRHLRTEGCGLPTVHVDPAEWLRTPTRRRR